MRVLSDLVDISAGYPFRGAIKPASEPDVRVVQMSDLTIDEAIEWAGVIGAKLPGRKPPKLLQQGDVIFVPRGRRYFAVALDEVPVEAVCSQHLLLLRIREPESLLPGFLAWQINHDPMRSRISAQAVGSTQSSVPAKALRGLPFPLPPLSVQRELIALHADCVSERQVLTDLIDNRAKQIAAVAEECCRRYSDEQGLSA